MAAARKPRFTLLVRWDKGEDSRVDVSGMIETFRLYEPLRRSPELFRRVRVGELGTDIVWTDEIDMSADTGSGAVRCNAVARRFQTVA